MGAGNSESGSALSDDGSLVNSGADSVLSDGAAVETSSHEELSSMGFNMFEGPSSWKVLAGSVLGGGNILLSAVPVFALFLWFSTFSSFLMTALSCRRIDAASAVGSSLLVLF